jgi:hypothetical protein
MTSEQLHVDRLFVASVHDLSPEARKEATPTPRAVWLVQAADQWGQLYLKAFSDVHVGDAPLLSRTLPQSTSREQDAGQRGAYMRGYMLWYLCGRPDDDRPRFARGQTTTDLLTYTKTSSHPEGSASEAFRKKPSDYCTMQIWAERAYYRYLEAKPAPAAPPLPVAVVASTAEGSSSSSSNKRQMTVAAPAEPPAKGPKASIEPEMDHGDDLDKFYTAFREGRSRNKHHAWKPKHDIDKLRASVLEIVRNDQIIAPRVDEASKDERYTAIGYGDASQLMTMLKQEYKIDELFDRNKLVDPLPEAFQALGLEKLGQGTYNVVWRFRDDATPDAVKKFLPDGPTRDVSNSKCVLRMPRPDTTLSICDIAVEMTSLLEASFHGFGPKIYAMWCERSLETTPGDGYTEAKYKLFVLMERGTMSMFERLQQLKDPKSQTTDEQWAAYMYGLRVCIFRMSAHRCIHLDCKPANFVDTYPKTMPNKYTGLRTKVIDLDGTFYGRVERLTTAEAEATGLSPNMSMGWKPCWLYNTLAISCHLRVLLDSVTYHKFWWWNETKQTGIKKAVEDVMKHVENQRAYTNDVEYARARRFLIHKNADWVGRFYMNSSAPPQPDGCKSVETLALLAVQNAKHYYHDEWWNYAKRTILSAANEFRIAHLASMQAIQTGQSEAMRMQRAEVANRKGQKCAEAWQWYEHTFWKRALPMIRFFAMELVKNERDATTKQAKRLYTVLYQYAKLTDAEVSLLLFPPRSPNRTNASTTILNRAEVDQQYDEFPPPRYQHDFIIRHNWGNGEQLSKDAAVHIGFNKAVVPHYY